MAKVVNLTPHDCNIVVDGKEVITFPASGDLARCAQVSTPVTDVEVDGVKVACSFSEFGEIIGLPEAEEGVIFFVSALVANAAWKLGRTDVVCPGKAVRDAEGRIIGTEGFSVMPR